MIRQSRSETAAVDPVFPASLDDAFSQICVEGFVILVVPAGCVDISADHHAEALLSALSYVLQGEDLRCVSLYI